MITVNRTLFEATHKFELSDGIGDLPGRRFTTLEGACLAAASMYEQPHVTGPEGEVYEWSLCKRIANNWNVRTPAVAA